LILIEILAADGAEKTRPFTYTDKKTGEVKSGEERTQVAYLHNGGPYPVRFKLGLGREQQAYAPGRYELLPTSIIPGRFDGLQCTRVLELRRLADAKAA